MNGSSLSNIVNSIPTNIAFDITGPKLAIISDFLLSPKNFLTNIINNNATTVADVPTITSIMTSGLNALLIAHPSTKPKKYLLSINTNKTSISATLNCTGP